MDNLRIIVFLFCNLAFICIVMRSQVLNLFLYAEGYSLQETGRLRKLGDTAELLLPKVLMTMVSQLESVIW